MGLNHLPNDEPTHEEGQLETRLINDTAWPVLSRGRGSKILSIELIL
jgi:hypothetical protein